MLFPLTSCFNGRNHVKNKELLLERISEITEEKFEILTFSGNANEGDFDFSKYKSQLKWTKDENVKFTILFNIKKGEVVLTDETFNSYFNRAKKNVDDAYMLIELAQEKFTSFKLSSSYFENNDYTINLFLDRELRDTSYLETIDEIRWFGKSLTKKLNGEKVRVRVSFTRDLNDIPNSVSNQNLYESNGGGNGYMYSSVVFNYKSKYGLKDGEIKFLEDQLDYNAIETYTRAELHPAISEILTKRHKDKTVLVSKIEIPKEWGDRYDAKLIEKVEWQLFSAIVTDQRTSAEIEKVKGKINIYTKEIRIDE